MPIPSPCALVTLNAFSSNWRDKHDKRLQQHSFFTNAASRPYLPIEIPAPVDRSAAAFVESTWSSWVALKNFSISANYSGSHGASRGTITCPASKRADCARKRAFLSNRTCWRMTRQARAALDFCKAVFGGQQMITTFHAMD